VFRSPFSAPVTAPFPARQHWPLEILMKLTHVLSIDQFDKPLIEELFYHANWISKAKGHSISHLRGKLLANLFYEASTRTSSSFFAAMSRLGGRVLPINDVTFSSVSKGEILEDTIRTLACYTDIIVLRHPEMGAAQRAAAVSPVPIVNAGDGVGEHPTQALLDLYTIMSEQGRIDGLSVTMMGDLKHGRTVHSLARLLRLYDVKINFVSPIELRMPADLVHPADRQVEKLDEVLTDTDVLYVTRVQKERFEATGDYDYGLTLDHMARAKPTMSVMHPLPRVNEIPLALDADPRAAYFRQMQNGLFVRMALLMYLLG
jgi:aspartate carbamoyltransferase catalytic subunit